MKLIIFKNLKDLQTYCAKAFINEVQTNPFAKIGFATGVSPIAAYQLIVQDHQKNGTSWKNVTTFNLDEFVGIDPQHPEAFIKQMKNNLFDHLDLQPKNIYIPNSLATNLAKECADYEAQINKHDKIDFQYISLGVNGHMAYNEPGTDFNSFTHVAQLTPETILDMVAKKKFVSPAISPKQAITMGIQTLLHKTRKAIMVSYGTHKALVTKRMLEDVPNNKVTASYLQLHPDCTFVLDEGAASMLSLTTLAQAERR